MTDRATENESENGCAELQSPFPYFGGKSRIAPLVWKRFGKVRNFVEPFAGSLAVLLARPHPFSGTETISDLDAYLENFWRAVQADPEAVASHMDWPVNEVRLEAVHKWLVTRERKREHALRMKDELDYFDAKIAGYWCWGLCCWIGRGWCAGEWVGPESEENAGCGINVRDPERGGKMPQIHRPHGVHRQIPNVYRSQGVHRQMPHLSIGGGMGVHRAFNGQGDADLGECARRTGVLIHWMRLLSDRLRNVRVVCGDWSRVCGPTPTFLLGTTAVFLDPPYSAEAGRDSEIYSHESGTAAHDVRGWCLEQGPNPKMRIALCGYEGEGHEELEAAGWEVVAWKAGGGYGVQGTKKRGEAYVNKHRERIRFSPACISADAIDMPLFAGLNGHALPSDL